MKNIEGDLTIQADSVFAVVPLNTELLRAPSIMGNTTPPEISSSLLRRVRTHLQPVEPALQWHLYICITLSSLAKAGASQ